MKDKQENIIAEMKPFGFTDDVTIITNIIPAQQQTQLNQRKRIKIPKKIQIQITEMMQATINTITEHLSINNIPQNEDKTHIMTIKEPQLNRNKEKLTTLYNQQNQHINNRLPKSPISTKKIEINKNTYIHNKNTKH